MKKQIASFVLASLCFVGLAYPQSLVKSDQGKPGNQGPWPVSISGGSVTAVVGGTDGGILSTLPAQCRAVQSDGGVLHKNTVVGVTAVPVPTIQTLTRAYVELCNSLQNSGNPTVKCRVDGTAPVMAATNAGDVLGIGDCIVYAVPSSTAPQCIADTASTNVTSYDCVPL